MQIRPLYPSLCAMVITYASLCGCSSNPSGGTQPTQTTLDAASPVDAAGETPPVALDAGADTTTSGTAGYPAPHASFPRVESLGGPVLTRPVIVPVFFANDPLQPQIEQFLAQLAGSSYWAATTSEYGVGPLQVAPSIIVPDQAPSAITAPEITSWLASYLDGTHADWPAIDGQHVYVAFYPQDTTITQPSGATSCMSFGAYHAEGSVSVSSPTGANDGGMTADAADADGGSDASIDAGGPPALSLPFPFAIIPRCTTFNTLSGIDSLTAAISHELIETATNPLARTRRAYALVDFDHVAWALGLGGNPFIEEVSDLCGSESPDRAFQRLVGDFMVQRSWSNRAAAANQEPCVPGTPDVYFGAAPEFDELDSISNDGGVPSLLLTSGERLAVGQSRTIDVRLFSTGPTPDWYVSVRQLLGSPGAPTTLRTVLDKSSGNNGDVLKLTITRTANGPSFGGTVIYLVSTLAPVTSNVVPSPYNRWYGFVQN